MENQGQPQERYNTISHINALIEMVKEANNVPFSDKCAIEKDYFISELENLKNRLPMSVSQSNDIVARAQEIIQAARDKSKSIILQADTVYAQRVNEHEITAGAKLQAEQILTEANKRAEDLRRSAHQYVKEELEKASSVLSESSAKIQTNIAEIDAALYSE